MHKEAGAEGAGLVGGREGKAFAEEVAAENAAAQVEGQRELVFVF